MSKIIYSTLSAPVCFRLYEPKSNPSGLPLSKALVTIEGKAGIAVYNNAGGIFTHQGYATVISDQNYEWLKDHPTFKNFVKRGHYVVSDEKGGDPAKLQEKANKKAKDMVPDPSAPLKPNEFGGGGRVPEATTAPKSNNEK